MSVENRQDPIPAIERAISLVIEIYDRADHLYDAQIKAKSLAALSYLRQARKEAQ